MPDENNNDFTLLEYASDFWGHVLDGNYPDVKKACFVTRGCTIYLNLKIKDGADDLQFGSVWIKNGLEKLYDNEETVRTLLKFI